MKIRTILMIVLLVAGVATLPMPAAAYVRTMTESGVATAWKTPCVTMEFSLVDPVERGLTPGRARRDQPMHQRDLRRGVGP
jgi:hypothetical protein